MIVGSLRGIVMIPPFYERFSDTAAESESSTLSPQRQSESTNRTPDDDEPEDPSAKADFAAVIATEPL